VKYGPASASSSMTGAYVEFAAAQDDEDFLIFHCDEEMMTSMQSLARSARDLAGRAVKVQ
jgi:hypothetical protein